MAFTITDDEALKQQKQLKASYDMYENTKRETKRVMRDALNEDGTKKYTKEQINERIGLIEKSQAEIIEKYILFGGKEEDLKTNVKRTTRPNIDEIEPFYFKDDEQESSPVVENIALRTTNSLDAVSAQDNDNAQDNKDDFNSLDVVLGTKTVTEVVAPQVERLDEDINKGVFIPTREDLMNDTNFDMVTLPSNGECYMDKMTKIAVSYLNAFDENIITAPNLYRDNTVIDTILRRKIMSDTISCDDLLEGDRDAIILFLRATGFGTEYPITARDNISGKEFDTVFDLSTLKFKKFNLRGDQNGWFDFTLPLSQKKIKFKFLTHKDVRLLERAEEFESNSIKKEKLGEMTEELESYVDNDKKLGANERIEIRNAIKTINKWRDDMSDDAPDNFTHTFTNTLELTVMSVDGNTDRKYIRNFVRNMNIRDSSALKKYIDENEPGIDYNITVERPESLGGGSMNVFLQIDQYLFLNVSDRL